MYIGDASLTNQPSGDPYSHEKCLQKIRMEGKQSLSELQFHMNHLQEEFHLWLQWYSQEVP